jgi:hypothetical protein
MPCNTLSCCSLQPWRWGSGVLATALTELDWCCRAEKIAQRLPRRTPQQVRDRCRLLEVRRGGLDCLPELPFFRQSKVHACPAGTLQVLRKEHVTTLKWRLGIVLTTSYLTSVIRRETTQQRPVARLCSCVSTGRHT